MENPSDSTDYDYDGGNDALEDADDDNDGILDVDDQCDYTPYSPPRPTWVSNAKMISMAMVAETLMMTK